MAKSSIPFRGKSHVVKKKTTPMMYKFSFAYYESVKHWASPDGVMANTRVVESISIPAACELFHDSVHKIYPEYYVSNISILPIVPGISRSEQPTEE